VAAVDPMLVVARLVGTPHPEPEDELVVKLACAEYPEQFAFTCHTYAAPATNPLSTREADAVLTVVHVLVVDRLYCKVYPVAPLTADQLNVAPVCVMAELDKFTGTLHPDDDVVVNDAWAE
jgi:hypothetical protein